MPDISNKIVRALVIADSDVGQDLYQEQLCSMGIDCCATQCFGEAQRVLDVVVENKIPMGLVVLDCKTFDDTSENFIAMLRNHSSFEETIIIAAIDGASDENLFVPKRVNETLARPVSPSLFEDAVAKYFDINMADLEEVGEVDPSNFQLDILIAEDNEVNQIVFTEVLNDLGVRFKIAGNGQEAVELWKSHNPAVVLMDVSMPVMSGHEATKTIRAIEKESGLRHTPICAITAHALKGDKDDCFAAGMDDYLSKPVSPDIMAKKIASLLPDSHPLNGMPEPARVA